MICPLCHRPQYDGSNPSAKRDQCSREFFERFAKAQGTELVIDGSCYKRAYESLVGVRL